MTLQCLSESTEATLGSLACRRLLADLPVKSSLYQCTKSQWLLRSSSPTALPTTGLNGLVYLSDGFDFLLRSAPSSRHCWVPLGWIVAAAEYTTVTLRDGQTLPFDDEMFFKLSDTDALRLGMPLPECDGLLWRSQLLAPMTVHWGVVEFSQWLHRFDVGQDKERRIRAASKLGKRFRREPLQVSARLISVQRTAPGGSAPGASRYLG